MFGTVSYYVQGDPASQQQFRLSYRQLRVWHDGPVVVVSDLARGWDVSQGYSVSLLRQSRGAPDGKTLLFDYVAAERVLFLDCGVLVIRPLNGIWDALSRADLAVTRDCPSMIGESTPRDARSHSAKSRADPCYDCGVFAWRRNDAVRRLFHAWRGERSRTLTGEQSSFARAVRETRLRVAELPGTYSFDASNVRSLPDAESAGIVCLHFASGFTQRMADFVDQPISCPYARDPLTICHRDHLGTLFTNLGFEGDGVEIGVQAGAFSSTLRTGWRGGRLHLVDRWRNENGYVDAANVPQEQHDRLYAHVCDVFKDDPSVVVIRDDSVRAASRFSDASLDWIYLDADHSHDAVCRDLEAWYPKVRPGGIVAGHDFVEGEIPGHGRFGVRTAVSRFAARLGHKLYMTTEGPWPSWYFRKP